MAKIFAVFISLFFIVRAAAFAAQAEAELTAPAETAPAAANAAVKRYGDWFYHCVPVASSAAGGETEKPGKKAAEACEIFQLRQITRSGKAIKVLSLNIAGSAAGLPGRGAPACAGGRQSFTLTVIAPLNIDLPSGLRQSIGGYEIFRMAYNFCSRAGCVARRQLSPQNLAMLRRGGEGEAQFRLVDGRNVHISFSLRGFAEALAALQKGN